MIHWSFLIGAFALGWWLNGRRWRALFDDLMATAQEAVAIIKRQDGQVHYALDTMNRVGAALDVYQTRRRARVFSGAKSAGFPAKSPPKPSCEIQGPSNNGGDDNAA